MYALTSGMLLHVSPAPIGTNDDVDARLEATPPPNAFACWPIILRVIVHICTNICDPCRCLCLEIKLSTDIQPVLKQKIITLVDCNNDSCLAQLRLYYPHFIVHADTISGPFMVHYMIFLNA